MSHRTEEAIRGEIDEVQQEIAELKRTLRQREQHLAALEKEVGITMLTKFSSKVEHTVDAVKRSAAYAHMLPHAYGVDTRRHKHHSRISAKRLVRLFQTLQRPRGETACITVYRICSASTLTAANHTAFVADFPPRPKRPVCPQTRMHDTTHCTSVLFAFSHRKLLHSKTSPRRKRN